ncbi:MAG: MBL fold metallo-hydrolase [Sporolactobacillus sp.]
MKWITCCVGPIHENCYLLENEAREALIIDPGAEYENIREQINRRQLRPLAVLLTHAHFDHIGALDQTRDRWKIPAYLHKQESDWPANPEKNGSAYFTFAADIHARPAEHILTEEGLLQIGNFSFHVLETPGHSPGGVSYYFEGDKVVFSGDALFKRSIGRSDGYGADGEVLLNSIREKLMRLPAETIVCPGHGQETSIGEEIANNPFLRQ